MYTNQIANIVQRLIASGMPTETAQVIAEFGNCSAPLDHRAPVTVDATPPAAPDRDVEEITPANLSDWYYTARFSNWESNVVNNIVEGGLTVMINGTLYVDHIVGPGGEVISPGDTVTVQVVSDVRIAQVSTDWKLQKKTRNIKVVYADVESEWTDVYTFEAQNFVVENVTWDASGNKKIQQSRVPDVFVIKKGEAVTSDVLTASLLQNVVRGSDYDFTTEDTFVNSITSNVYVLDAGADGTVTVFDTESCITDANNNVNQSLSGAGAISAATDFLTLDTTSAGFPATLPAHADATKQLLAESTGTAGNLATIAADGADTISGQPSIAMADGETWMFWKGATEWRAKKID